MRPGSGPVPNQGRSWSDRGLCGTDAELSLPGPFPRFRASMRVLETQTLEANNQRSFFPEVEEGAWYLRGLP
jgi:hypothetical protein